MGLVRHEKTVQHVSTLFHHLNLGISFVVFLNLIIIAARVYKLRLAEVNFFFLYYFICIYLY